MFTRRLMQPKIKTSPYELRIYGDIRLQSEPETFPYSDLTDDEIFALYKENLNGYQYRAFIYKDGVPYATSSKAYNHIPTPEILNDDWFDCVGLNYSEYTDVFYFERYLDGVSGGYHGWWVCWQCLHATNLEARYPNINIDKLTIIENIGEA